jgi:hypothetical protein
MLSKEYLKTARMLRRAALRITDRMVAGRLSSLCGGLRATSREGRAGRCRQSVGAGRVKIVLPSISLSRAIAGRTGRQLAERALEKIEDPAASPQERVQRRRKLTKEPSEFREDRFDWPGIYFPS